MSSSPTSESHSNNLEFLFRDDAVVLLDFFAVGSHLLKYLLEFLGVVYLQHINTGRSFEILRLSQSRLFADYPKRRTPNRQVGCREGLLIGPSGLCLGY